MNGYVYVISEPGLWTVGFYAPDGKWEAESDHPSRENAAERVAWLNGGEAASPGARDPYEKAAAVLKDAGIPCQVWTDLQGDLLIRLLPSPSVA